MGARNERSEIKVKQVTMDSPGKSAPHRRNRRLVVSSFDSTTVEAVNRKVVREFRLVQERNRAATPPPPITEMVGIHDPSAQSVHVLFVHRLDYRPRRESVVRNVVVFSEPSYAASCTDRLQLATPAYYRRKGDLKPGIGDAHDGSLVKDGTQWARAIVPLGPCVRHAEMSFVSESEPWVYCASHYQWDRELRQLRDEFAEKYGYTAAVRIRDPSAFAIRLGIDFVSSFDRTTDVEVEVLDEIIQTLRRSASNPSGRPGPTSSEFHVYHGPIHYEDSSGHLVTQRDFLDTFAGPRAWFTKRTCFETQSEYRFAVSPPGSPVAPKHYITVSPELRELVSAL